MILKVDNLSFKYKVSDKKVLKNINFSLEEGDFLAIIGHNNSGKSSLCYALNGLIPNFFKGDMEGSVIVNGLDTKKTPIGELVSQVGLVFQNPFTQLSGTTETVYEELAIGLENYGVPREEMIERIEMVLKNLGIEDLKDRLPFALSGGQQQKVALASILVMQPKILILDEPTSQLDPGASEEIFKLVAKLKEKGTTIIIVEHKLEEIAEYCNKVMVLDDGETRMLGKPSEILNNKKLYDFGIRPTKYAELGIKLTDENLWHKEIPIRFTDAEKMVGEVING